MPNTDKKIALFPGTFDPITLGHLDVIRRGVGLFHTLIVAVGQNPSKAELFTPAERVDMIEQILKSENIDAQVASYTGLTVDFAAKSGATVILRGLRDATDLAMEFQLALTNRAVADIETVLIMSGESHGFTSSSLIKQIAAAGNIDRLSSLLPPLVIERMKQRTEAIAHLANLSDGHKT